MNALWTNQGEMRSGLFEFNRGLVYERMKFSFNTFLFEMHSPKKKNKKGKNCFQLVKLLSKVVACMNKQLCQREWEDINVNLGKGRMRIERLKRYYGKKVK